jgi:hypothetical protein
MPCYQINTVSVEFKAANKEILQKAVKALGWRFIGELILTDYATITIKDGQATGVPSEVNALRTEYARQVVDHAKAWAQSKGWQVSSKKRGHLNLKKLG